MINALIVVYRESFEALLIVGLLYSFLVRRNAHPYAFRAIGAGAVVGLALSALLALGIYKIESEIGGFALEMFQFAMMVLAVVLITQMCIWMRIHARNLKSELESGASKAIDTGHLFSLALLTAIAVGREGSETVIFLYGMLSESVQSGKLGTFIMMSCTGLMLGILTWFAFQKGFSFFKQKTFFTFSSILLFVTAGSMMITISSKIIEFDWIQLGRDQMWDSSWLLTEKSAIGSIFQIITGYRAQPSQFTVFMYASYWIVTLLLFYWASRSPRVPAFSQQKLRN